MFFMRTAVALAAIPGDVLRDAFMLLATIMALTFFQSIFNLR
jgi:hypothetical protein